MLLHLVTLKPSRSNCLTAHRSNHLDQSVLQVAQAPLVQYRLFSCRRCSGLTSVQRRRTKDDSAPGQGRCYPETPIVQRGS
jgi:hypothetical protein